MGLTKWKNQLSKINHLKKKLLMLLMFYANLFIIVKIAVYLLSKLFKYNREELLKGVDILINSFNNFFKIGNILIKTNSVEAVIVIKK